MRGLALGLVLLWSACGEGASPGSSGAGLAARATGPVVARVNGDPIGLDEVRTVCASSGLSPEQALARLEDERLLAQYAEARGYGALVSRLELERARARALLEQAVDARAQGLDERRQELSRLLTELRGKTRVVFDENAVRQALSDDGTLGPDS